MSTRFEDLKVYQKALVFVDEVYKVLRVFPLKERFVLIDQLRRAALLIPLNIAEGSGSTSREFQRYLSVARGSALECLASLQVALRQGYIIQAKYQQLDEQCRELTRMLSGLRNKL